MQFISLLGISVFITCLVVMETLQDVYMQSGLSPEWRQKMKDGVKAMCNISLTDEHMDMFVDALADNTLQKLDLLKVIIWANTGLFMINSIEDSVQEKLGGLKTGFLNKIKDFKLPSKFSKVGGTAKVVTDLVVQKNQQVKKLSDYIHQGTMSGSNLQNAYNTSSLPTMVRHEQFNKLSPKEQASYQIAKEMLNTVQASR